MMIASGNNMSSPASNNNIGAGSFVLPTNATLWLNKVSVTNGVNQDFSFTVPSGRSRVKVALWWPEPKTTHNDVDLSLLTGSGSTVSTSLSGSSIWEKTSAAVTAGNTYKVRARGYSVTGSQTVFMAVIAQ